jgi:hypothetical protein
MAKGNEYTERYCAYVDILGFRQLIDELRAGRSASEKLRSLLTRIHQPHQGDAV